MENEDDLLIQKYLNGALEEPEKQAFQERLKVDTAFKEVFTFRKSVDIFFKKETGLPVLEAQFETFGKEFFVESATEQQTKAKVIPMYKKPIWIALGAVAASIALILLLYIPSLHKDLYQQYAVHQSINLVEKSDTTTSIAQAESYFNKGNYDQAYPSLKEYLQANTENQRAQLALGISALELGKQEEAISIFTTIHEGTSLLKASGTWYLALAYVKQKEFEKAKTLLLQIPNTDALLYQNAQALIRELD